MGQVIIRQLDDVVIQRLKERAARHNQSLEQELRNVLTEAAKPTRADKAAIMESVRRHIKKPFTVDVVELIREDRDSR